MRTIQLTDSEIAIILRALGIAELKFHQMRKNYDAADFDGDVQKAIESGAILPNLNIAQEEASHLRYNIYTNEGYAFMPTPMEDLLNDLVLYMKKHYPHIQTKEELATEDAYRRIYSD